MVLTRTKSIKIIMKTDNNQSKLNKSCSPLGFGWYTGIKNDTLKINRLKKNLLNNNY